MTIKEYVWLLLPSSMKRTENSDAFKLSVSFGNRLDKLMAAIFALRTQSTVSTAVGEGLVELGKDEELEKLSGESEEEFRRRILSIKSIKSGLIRKDDLEQAIRTLGYSGATIRELYKEKYAQPPDPARVARWAEFEIAIPSEDIILTANDRERIQYVANYKKPGWTKGTIIYKYLTVGEVDQMTIGQLKTTKIQAFKGAILP